ncbi:MAG: hypothetical protein GXO60_06245, partial [Epsilonproteobacteria bacterium]|nr:hypothetical protein [Campylobacterota bacterium]
YNTLGLKKEERFRFREKFGFISKEKKEILTKRLDKLIDKYSMDNDFYAYSIVSLSTGIDKNFLLYDGLRSLSIDELSTVRKRLNTSRLNSVPFFIFSNQKQLTKKMRLELKKILFDVFY